MSSEQPRTFRLFDLASRWLTPDMRRRLGGSRWLAPVRNALLRPGGKAATTGGEVSFGGRDFYFSGPFHTFQRARSRGIERTLSRLLAAKIEPGSSCVDVGAHCGWLSLQMAFATGPEGSVVAYEADPTIGPHLRENLVRNGLSTYCRERVVRVGPRDVPSPAQCQAGTEDAEQVGESSAHGSFQEICLDLDLPRLGVDSLDLLKVDVDGGDLGVLQGAQQTLRHHRPMVIVEMTELQEEIFVFLRGQGYTAFYGMDLRPMTPGQWPENMVACCRPLG